MHTSLVGSVSGIYLTSCYYQHFFMYGTAIQKVCLYPDYTPCFPLICQSMYWLGTSVKLAYYTQRPQHDEELKTILSTRWGRCWHSVIVNSKSTFTTSLNHTSRCSQNLVPYHLRHNSLSHLSLFNTSNKVHLTLYKCPFRLICSSQQHTHAKKMIGCFNHRVVTLVAWALRSQLQRGRFLVVSFSFPYS